MTEKSDEKKKRDYDYLCDDEVGQKKGVPCPRCGATENDFCGGYWNTRNQ